MKTEIINITTDARLAKIARKFCFPGFYFDVNGLYCIHFGRYLLSVFINNDTDTIDVAVDELSEAGTFDMNVEWETPVDEQDLSDTVRRFMVKYGRNE